MAQWEKGLALKMSDMNSLPETHMVEGATGLSQVVSSDLCACSILALPHKISRT